MRVYNSWSRKEYIKGHVPEEFRAIAELLTSAQIEALSESIDAYYHRIRSQIEGRTIAKIHVSRVSKEIING